jgi:large subunit ribosomal protein L24
MSSKWIKKDDFVVMLCGNDKGKIGKVLVRKDDRIIVQGVNVKKKHLKKTQKMQKSQIVEMETPFNISKVALCRENGEKISLKVKMTDKGKDLVYQTKNGKETVYRSLRKL